MAHLPPFWHAAAQLTGRIDLQPHLDRCSVPDSIRSRATQSGPLSVNDPFITLQDGHYPSSLRPVPYCPPVLFVRGNLELLDRPAVAIVGARRCTGNGQTIAHRISRGCAVLGGVTVSGMAYGIDQAAHLAAPGSTIAVLGQGLDAPMSPHQQRLADRILEDGGLLLSEFLPSHPAHRWTFPLRNRVIAGLGRATVIVEAGTRSGALHTARHALDAGRDVLAVPGSPLAPSSAGCLNLLEQGAGLARSAADLVPYLCTEPSEALTLLQELTEGATIETLQRRTGLPPTTLAAQLTELELTGLVTRSVGDIYRILP